MPADERHTVLSQCLKAAAHNLAENREIQPFFRKTGDGQGRQRSAAHCPYVVDRIERGDPPVVKRVVNNRSEKVHSLHEGQIIAQLIHSGVVRRFKTDEQVRIMWNVQFPQNLGEYARREFRRSTGARNHFGQSLFHLMPHRLVISP